MEKYVSYIVLRKVNDNCYFAHRLFSFSLMLLTIVTYTTDLEDTVILGGRFDHDYAKKEDRTIEMQALRRTYKHKAVAEPCERPNKLITRSVNRGNSACTL